MEHREIDIIQELIDNEQFRKLVFTQNNNEPLLLERIQAFDQYKKEDLEAAAHIIRSQEKDESPKINANKKKIWKAVEIAADEFDRLEKRQVMEVSTNRRRWRKVFRYAAVLAGLLMVATWLIMDKAAVENYPVPVQMVSKSNPSGQKSRIQLVDGSVVHLNAESELRYEEGFNNRERRIYLIGEAYFEVAKDKARPFTVVSGGLEITALGTEFNVDAYADDVQVALLEGSVLVSHVDSNQQLELKPMEIAGFNSQSHLLNRMEGNADNLVLWRNRVIYFEDTPFDEAIKVLSRWYAVEIEARNVPTQSLSCAGKFDNSSLEVVLKNLGFTLGFDYEINGKNVTLNFNN